MQNNTELSERLRQFRKNAGLSQEQLAEALDISRQAISKWESGTTSPDVHNIVQLGKLYGVSTDSILLGETHMPADSDAVPENACAVQEKTCTMQKNTDAAPKTATTAPQKEEKPPVRDRFPLNGFLWVVLGTIIVLVLYWVTNIW